MEKTRLTLRLPPELAEQAASIAAQLGLTMNAFTVQAVRNWADWHGKRLAQQRPESVQPAAVQRRPPGTKADTATVPKVGPNQPCPCGSGQKYKRCHGKP